MRASNDKLCGTLVITRIFTRAVLVFVTVVAGAEIGCSSDDKPPSASTSSSSGGGDGNASDSSTPRADAATTNDATPADDDGGDEPDATTPVDARVCLGDTTPNDASTAGPCPTSGDCAASCGKMATHFRPGVAYAAAECIATRPDCTIDDVQPCIDHAALDMCPSSTAKSYCEAFVLRCDPNAGGMGAAISQEGCEQLATALGDQGRTVFRDCIEAAIAAGTCIDDVVKCTEKLRL